MPRPNLLAGELSRQQWWTGLMVLIAIWLVWSLASGFIFAGEGGQTASAWISLVFLIPLTVLCAKRLNHLGRPLLPVLPLLMAPFVLHTVLTRMTELGGRETVMDTGISETAAIVMAPSIAGWVVLAWLLGAMVWMVAVLGMRPATGVPAAADARPT